MVITKGHLVIIVTTRAGPAPTMVIDRLRPADNKEVKLSLLRVDMLLYIEKS